MCVRAYTDRQTDRDRQTHTVADPSNLARVGAAVGKCTYFRMCGGVSWLWEHEMLDLNGIADFSRLSFLSSVIYNPRHDGVAEG